MKYDHMVKVNGKYYQAGENVPEAKNKAVDKSPLPFSDDNIEFETKENKIYTKSEINRMSTADLQELAANDGIENAYEMTGGELKKALIEHFGL